MNYTEAEFQKDVIDLAHLYKWRVAHFRKARTLRGSWITPVAADGKGFVDLVLVRDKILYRELKVGYGKLTEEQKQWGQAIQLAGGDWKIWRPEVLDLIRKELQ